MAMPEELEVETEKLEEAIHEALEPEGGSFLKAIALSTALLAALAAVAALQAGATVNEALMLKTDSTRLQAEAADQWAFYQAKGIKATVQEASRAAWLAAGKVPPTDFAATAKRYGEEQNEIQKAATEKERERDIKSAEADHLFHRHHGFANSVAILQVAIAVGAVAALTRVKSIWFASLVLGIVGGGVLLSAWLH
jgi:hypothetical protein